MNMITTNWLNKKARWAKFNSYEGILKDSVEQMRVDPGKSDAYKLYKTASGNSGNYKFLNVNQFFEEAEITKGRFIPIREDLELGINGFVYMYTYYILINKNPRFGYSLKYFKLALKLVKNAEIGVPDRILPLVVRNDKLTALLAPCVEEKEE